MALQLFIEFYNDVNVRLSFQLQRPATSLEIIPSMIIPSAILFSLPIILSLVFSKLNPEVQIVSPLNIQIISMALFIIISFQYVSNPLDLVGMVAYWTIFIGWVQDGIALTLLGRTADKNDILTASFIAYTDVEHLKSILLTKKFRSILGLRKKAEETDECGVILRSHSKTKYQLIVSLTNETQKDKTFVDIAIFEKGRYALKRTEELEEYTIEKADYLKNILKRPGNSIKIGDVSSSHAENLQAFVIDEMQGKLIGIQKITWLGWLKIIVVILSVTFSLVLCNMHLLSFENMLIILVTIILYAIFEAPIRRRER